MAVNWDDLVMMEPTAPPRVLIYGPPGLGKTTLAAEWPQPFFLQYEDGVPAGLQVATLGLRKSYQDCLEIMEKLKTDNKYEFKTLVIDSLDKMEPLLQRHVCQAKGWQSVESVPYGKGWSEVKLCWQDFIRRGYELRERGIGLVFIAHSHQKTFNDPRTTSYDRYNMRLHKDACDVIEDEMDLILFLNTDVSIKTEDKGFNRVRGHAVGANTIWMNVRGAAAFNAKNRYGMENRYPFLKGQGYTTLAPYFPHINGGVQPEPQPEEQAAA